jgi:sortase B
MDYRIDLNYSNKILIYGHSAINKSLNLVPFNELEEYYSKDYYDIHKYIILELDSGVRTYEIFSVYIETSDFSYLELNFSSNDTWYNHLLSLKNNSIYETNVDITPYDEILILQTCSNSKDYSNYPEKYLLIVAKRI